MNFIKGNTENAIFETHAAEKHERIGSEALLA